MLGNRVLGEPRSHLRSWLLVAVIATLVLALFPDGTAWAHKVKRVTASSICHYEERYYVWTPGKAWWVGGRLKPAHKAKRVVLQRTKYGHSWKTWKKTRSRENGRYSFRGIAPGKGSRWWVNLRVVMRRQNGHGRVVSKPMYVDTNRYARCR